MKAKTSSDGYVLHRSQYGFEGLYVPPKLAFEFAEQARREQEVRDTEEAARREAVEAARRAKVQAASAPVFPVAAPTAAQGWYRVLPDYEAMLARLADIEGGGVHADREQGKRDMLSLRKAVEKGPDRQLCMPDFEVFTQLALESSLPSSPRLPCYRTRST